MKASDKRKKTYIEKLALLKNAGINNMTPATGFNWQAEVTEPLDERIKKVLGIIKNHKNTNMLFFVMYDIKNNKIRNYISKYLIKKGCTRVQKSIFLIDSSRPRFNEIYSTLKQVQDIYDNEDSIFLVPISTDHLKSMKIIGENIDFDLVLNNKNTLFF